MRAGLSTTVIGSFPKPSYICIPDWFNGRVGSGGGDATREMNKMLNEQTPESKTALEKSISEGISEIVDVQLACGVQVVTDGEIRRENYVHHICRMMEGVDFDVLTETSVRNGAYMTRLPTVRSKLRWKKGDDDNVNEVIDEWRKSHDLSLILNENVVKPLVNVGCKYIQIDEPVFAREPENALNFGLRTVEQCFQNINRPEGLRTELHMCCGYPEYIDQVGYEKAEKETYARLAPALDELHCIDAFSFEDAHRHNDLSELLPLFKKKQIIMGVVAIANSKIEKVDEIQSRLQEALKYIDRERLVVAPDCGLALLPRDVCEQKLKNMCDAAGNV